MIECNNCGCPALPLMLFWEGFLRARLPCVCGSLERAGERVGDKAVLPDTDMQVTNPDLYAALRAASEGMEERVVRVVAPRAIMDPDVYAQLCAADDGMMEAGAAPAARPVRKTLKIAANEAEFMKWLLTRDGVANVATVAAVTKLFRPPPLRGIFQASGALPAPQRRPLTNPEPEENPQANPEAEENPYMSGMSILANVF